MRALPAKRTTRPVVAACRSRRPDGSTRGAVRPDGLWLLLGIVVLGLASSAGYYRWKYPRVMAAVQERLDAAPTTAEGRLDAWLDFGRSQIHRRILSSRLSARQPWLATHTVRAGAGAGAAGPDGAPDVWGIDLDAFGTDAISREGLRVVVRFPEPRRLARAELVGDLARYVPAFASEAEAPDPVDRLFEIGDWMLAELAAALGRDIPGAGLELRAGGRRHEIGATDEE